MPSEPLKEKLTAAQTRIAELEKSQRQADARERELRDVVEVLRQQMDLLLRGGALFVDSNGSSPFKTIDDALAVARPGDTVMLRPGVYDVPIRLTDVSGVRVRGVSKEEAIIRVTGAAGVTLDGSAVLEDVTVEATDPVFPGVRVVGGHPQMQNVDVTSVNVSCIIVDGGAPVIQRCRLWGSLHFGVWWRAPPLNHTGGTTATLGRIEECEIWDNTAANVCVGDGAATEIAATSMFKATEHAVRCDGGSSTIISRSILRGSGVSCVEVCVGAETTIVESDVFQSEGCGINVLGSLCATRSRIFDNALPNVTVHDGGVCVLSECKVRGGMQQGIMKRIGGKLTMSDTQVHGNLLENVCSEGGDNA